MSSPFVTLKNDLSNFFYSPLRKYLFYVGNRTTSVHHTRLIKLNLSALNHELFKINCAVSSVCNFLRFQLKMLNISLHCRTLLFCAKYCLPPLHTCWVIA